MVVFALSLSQSSSIHCRFFVATNWSSGKLPAISLISEFLTYIFFFYRTKDDEGEEKWIV